MWCHTCISLKCHNIQHFQLFKLYRDWLHLLVSFLLNFQWQSYIQTMQSNSAHPLSSVLSISPLSTLPPSYKFVPILMSFCIWEWSIKFNQVCVCVFISLGLSFCAHQCGQNFRKCFIHYHKFLVTSISAWRDRTLYAPPLFMTDCDRLCLVQVHCK